MFAKWLAASTFTAIGHCKARCKLNSPHQELPCSWNLHSIVAESMLSAMQFLQKSLKLNQSPGTAAAIALQNLMTTVTQLLLGQCDY